MDAYCKCLSCETITLLADWSGPEHSGVSPCCKLQDARRKAWPPAAIQNIFEIAGGYDLNIHNEFCAATVLFESAVEMLFERSLYDLKIIYGSTHPISDFTMDMYLGRHTAEHFYNKLSDVSLGELLSSKNVDGFLRGWEIAVGIRNKIISGVYGESTADEKEAARPVFDKSLQAFAVIYNDVLRQKNEEAGHALEDKGHSIILVVDDEDAVRRYIVQAAERLGVKVFSAAAGRDAVELYRRYKPGCVFLDVGLPDIDGRNVLKQIKEIDTQANIYFITGYGGDAFARQAHELGAKGAFSKPLELSDIVATIKKETGV